MRPRPTRISLLILFALSLACSGWAPSAKPDARPRVIRLLWVQTSIHVTGNRSSWTSRLKNEMPQLGKPAGAPVGRELGFSDGSRASGALTLPGGVVEYSGTIKRHGQSGGLVVPVIDGTGSFAGATGTYTFIGRDQIHSKNALLVLHLRSR